MEKTVVVLTNDLFFSSHLEGGARQAGFALAMVSNLATLQEKLTGTACQSLVIDLAHADAANIATLIEACRSIKTELKIIAYAQHVQVARLKQARMAGCDQVTTRGDLIKSLPALLV